MTAVRRWAARVRNASLALCVIGLVLSVLAPSSSGAAAVPGSAGTDTALPPTDSEVTVRGRGAFSELEVTVNQTEDLVNQAVSITWTGGTPTTSAGGGAFGEHYLQIMQCWGDPDGTVPDNPGPPPEQCVQGATDAVFGGRSAGRAFPAGGFAIERIISRRDFETFDPEVGVLEDATGWVWRPFRSVKGQVVEAHYDTTFSPSAPPSDDGEAAQYWLNPFFDANTTNEVAGGRTRPNGTGEELFEVATGVQSTGLGCGQRVQPVAGGGTKIPRCWLVVVPRGSAEEENAGTGIPAVRGVSTSPLSTAAWANRIAVPLEFNPVDSACDISKDPRRLGGSELARAAITSWQPALCATTGLPPYTYALLGDAPARQQLKSGVLGAPGMVAVSRPFDPDGLDPANPVVYSPLTLSGVAVGFNIERTPKTGEGSLPEEIDLAGIRVADLNLTPRLVAKLLTQSYRAAVSIKGSTPAGYGWAADNPEELLSDPDFLQFNPEFELISSVNDRSMSGLVLPSGRSDIARQVWEWILADPEARSWLDGAPDEFGMAVNPVYATRAAANPTGLAFGDPVPEVFPKSDPHCFQAPDQALPGGGTVVPPILCGTDWMPYAQNLGEAARAARVADDGNRTAGPDPFAASAAAVYKREGPHLLGERTMMALVDTPRACLYGLQTAKLSRAGDNGRSRRFVAPDEAAMVAAVAAMRPVDEPDVLEPDPRADAPQAYPLTALTYAAAFPLALDEAAREEYAAFLSYATQDGQAPGRELGKLPAGYAALPPALQAQADEAIDQLRKLVPPAAPPAGSGTGGTSGGSPPLGGSSGVTLPRGSGSATGTRASSSGVPTAVTVVPPGEEDPEDTPVLGLIAPIVELAANRYALPVLALIALVSALVAVEITRRPGPQPASPPPTPPGRST